MVQNMNTEINDNSPLSKVDDSNQNATESNEHIDSHDVARISTLIAAMQELDASDQETEASEVAAVCECFHRGGGAR